jgi:hypothetical protein
MSVTSFIQLKYFTPFDIELAAPDLNLLRTMISRMRS